MNKISKILDYIKTNPDIILVVLVTLFALILRLFAIQGIGEMWYDELFTWFFASQETLKDVIKISLEQDVHMPIFFIMLHYWIQIFNSDTECMRYLSLIVSLPLVPCSYYFLKKSFNKTAGAFASIYLSFNTYCIYYSLEVRMYALNLLCSLLITAGFVMMLDNFEKKHTFLYIIATCVLLYNFTFAPMLAFCYFIIGLVHVLIRKKDKIKNYLITHLLIALIALPALLWTFKMFLEVKKTMIYYPLDIFRYNKFMIVDILENFFTKENVQINLTNYFFYPNLMDKLHDPHYWVFVIIPVIIALFAIVKAFFSKNERFYTLFLAPLLFFVVIFTSAFFDKATLQARYLTIIYPAVICGFAFGLSSFKNKIVSWILFIIFMYFNVFGVFSAQTNIYNMYRGESHSFSSIIGHQVKLRTDDFILNPMSGNKYMYYIKKGIYIPFCIDDAMVIREKNSGYFYFGKKFDTLTRDNTKQYLLDEALQDKIHPTYEQNFCNKYIKKMRKGQRIVYIVTSPDFLDPLVKKGLTKDNVKDFSIVDFLYSKVHRDSLLLLNKHLH